MRPSSSKESNAKKTSTKSNLSPFDKSKARSLTPPSYGIAAADNPQPLQAKFGNSFGRSGTLKRKGETGLPTQLKTRMEQMGGVDLSDVKVNYNSSKPQQIGARAYTRGNQIEIGSGQERHLAHEAWHAVQQKQGRVTPTTTLGKGLPVNNDAALEKEADVMGAKALIGSIAHINGTKNQIPISTSHQPTLQLKKKGGIQKKKTRTAGDVWVYVVEKGDYPIKIANEAYMSILKLAMLQHPSIIQHLGLEQKGHIDYTALVGVSAKDRDNEFWIKGFLKKWIIHPEDELLLEKVSGFTTPNMWKDNKKKEKNYVSKRKTRPATPWENWVYKKVDQNELDNIYGELADKNRVDGLVYIFKKLGAKTLEDVKVIYEQSKKGNFIGGVDNPFHPLNTRNDERERLYNISKKYPGLYTQDEVHFYYGNETGMHDVTLEELKDGSWAKYKNNK